MIRLAAVCFTIAVTSLGANCFHQVIVVDNGEITATAMAFAPDGRLFVAEKRGIVRVYNGDSPTEVLRVSVDDRAESGLVGLALDPEWTTSPYIYVHYRRRDTHAIVSRFLYQDGVIGVEEQLIDLGETRLIHLGGAMHFGPDGMLYIGRGESTRRNPFAQSTVFLEGKILRIARDGSIPADNPYGNAVWAFGFRNPFTFAFAPDGALYVNDVGENAYEEINVVPRAKNYGWPECEGRCDRPFAQPIYVYEHGEGGAAIAGAVFWNGQYYFADVIGGWISRLNNDGTASTIVEGANRPVDLDVSPDGRLYYLSVSGKVFRLDP